MVLWTSARAGMVAAAVVLAACAQEGRRDDAGLPRRATELARHGITWRFAGEHAVGEFANGDPWVVGPLEIAGIEPRCAAKDGRVVNGSMLDPDPSKMEQGYDSELFAVREKDHYRPELNVARGVDAEHPLRLPAGCSLVSIESMPDAAHVPQVKTAAVLTVVAEPPAPDAFRPPYVKGDKMPHHRAADLDWRVLRRVRPLPGVPPIETVAAEFERLWLDHFPSWTVRYVHPADNMPDYGREIAATVGSGGLLLNLDLPDRDKRDLLVRMVQLGIDQHGALRGGCRWPGLGGHGSGRKFSILLAGAVLHDERMLAVGTDFVSECKGPSDGTQYFAEDGQTFVVAETSPGVINWGIGGYGREHVGLPEWGFSHADEPKNDKASWDADPYRQCCSANGWVGEVLAARLMGLQRAWNHDALFAYLDRYMQATHAEAWHRAWLPWHAAMWDAYREQN